MLSKKGTNKNKIAPLEPTYKAPNAINWKPKFDAWNAILMAVNAKLAQGAEKTAEKTAPPNHGYSLHSLTGVVQLSILVSAKLHFELKNQGFLRFFHQKNFKSMLGPTISFKNS